MSGESKVKRVTLTERQCLTLTRALEFEAERLADGKAFSRLPAGRQDELVVIDGILDVLGGAGWHRVSDCDA